MFAQKEVQDTNKYAVNAISKAVIQFHKQKIVGYNKHMVISLKIMNISQTIGEFVLCYIITDYNYKDLNPTHYLCVNNELVLIIEDSTCNEDLEKYGMNKIKAEIKKEALKILIGPGMAITGDDPPLMVFKYDKNNIVWKFYDGYTPPKPQKKYRF
jgi:hypothetical protein